MAIVPKNKGDEDKVAQGIMRLAEEDPTIRFENNAETKEMVISGLGTQHLEVAVAKLKNKFGVEITLEVPRVPYRESIRKSCKAQGRHKKQTGGHGQFGDVWIEFYPCDETLEFAENVFGGSVPKNFFPAVEKGVRQAAQHGVLAGYPMVGLKATLLDGSYHPVDSSEMAFIMAAKLHCLQGRHPAGGPVLLEPIGALKATVPDDNTGDIMGEVNKRRGRVLGMSPAETVGYQTVDAEVPMAEMYDFQHLCAPGHTGQRQLHV